MKNLFEDNETVRIKATGEIVTIDHWWYSMNNPCFGYQYNIVDKPQTWFMEHELEKVGS